MGRRNILIVLVSFCAISVIGCSSGGNGNDKYQLTAEQKEFLSEISMNSERIEEGELYDWQIEILEQYDFAMEYLKTKYPSHSFDVKWCDPKNAVNPYTEFGIACAGIDDTFDLHIESDYGELTCKDNFYGYLISDDYASLLLDLLQEEIPECLFVESQFSIVQGLEYGEGFDVEELLSGNHKISNLTSIYLDGSSAGPEDLVQSVEEFLSTNSIYGGYTIIVLRDAPDDTVSPDTFQEFANASENRLVMESFQWFE